MKNKIKRFWYKFRYGIEISLNGSMMPVFGSGSFVSVFKKGGMIDLVPSQDSRGGIIRLIPYQPNHGLMVEYHDLKGNVVWRTLCDYNAFKRMGFSTEEKEIPPPKPNDNK